ncbi:hypothetical protein THAOC_25378, partial [Thalassiosira oceanica]
MTLLKKGLNGLKGIGVASLPSVSRSTHQLSVQPKEGNHKGLTVARRQSLVLTAAASQFPVKDMQRVDKVVILYRPQDGVRHAYNRRLTEADDNTAQHGTTSSSGTCRSQQLSSRSTWGV